MRSFLDVHAEKIKGSLSGFDRVRFRGTLRMLANSKGLGCFLHLIGVLLKDFREWSLELTGRIRRAAVELAGVRQRPVIYLCSCHTDKEALARRIAERDGITEGLICVLTCVESCQTFMIRKNAAAKKLELAPHEGRCLHQYFYVQHPLFGFMQMRVQTWAPFTVHVNINGREWLAGQLRQAGVAFEKRDNCFVDVADVGQAQALLDEQLRTSWKAVLGDLVREYHSTHETSQIFQREPYYWSADETEWATDVMFRSPQELSQLYPALVRHSVNHVGCQNVLHYLGRRSDVSRYREAEITTSVLRRHEGTRCKHSLDANSIKMYDKQESVLRIETTINDTRAMTVFRPKETDPDGPPSWLQLRKGVADLHRRAQLSQASNERYLADLASVEHTESFGQSLADHCRPTSHNGRRVRALNPFQAVDHKLLEAVNQGEFLIQGFRNRDIKRKVFGDDAQSSRTKVGRRQSGQVTRWLTLLRAHRLIKKVPRTHRYMLSEKGRIVVTAILAAKNASTKQLAAIAA
ncbi:MAG: hypothetical protein ACKOBW_09090 [Planctomycetota bacterium]